MSNKNNNDFNNIDTEEINKTVENITKNLFKTTFEDNNVAINKKETNNSYENYKSELKNYEDKFSYDNDDEYEDYEDNYTTKKNKYRKNIDKYSKEFFYDDEDDEYEDYEEKGSLFFKILNISIIAALAISTSVLAFNLKATKNKVVALKEENQKLIDKNQDTENKIREDSLKNEIAELESKNMELENIINKNNSNEIPTEKISEATSQNTTKPPTQSNNNNSASNNSTISEYTVKERDSFWKISQEVYGNGSYYQKIIEANNLTENSTLTPGQKLKIPKIN